MCWPEGGPGWDAFRGRRLTSGREDLWGEGRWEPRVYLLPESVAWRRVTGPPRERREAIKDGSEEGARDEGRGAPAEAPSSALRSCDHTRPPWQGLGRYPVWPEEATASTPRALESHPGDVKGAIMPGNRWTPEKRGF